jgi:hypothetical protein
LGTAGSLTEPRVAQLYPARLGGLQRRDADSRRRML